MRVKPLPIAAIRAFPLVVACSLPQATALAAPLWTRDLDGDGVVDLFDPSPQRIPGSSAPDATGWPTAIDYSAALTFDHGNHRAWYRRFWTGSCKGVDGWCFSGKKGSSSPRRAYWLDTVDRCVAGLPGEEAGRLRSRLWVLGIVIGHEWARDNGVRAIDSDDIKRWGKRLTSALAGDLEAVLEEIAATAVKQLGGTPPAHDTTGRRGQQPGEANRGSAGGTD